MEEYQLAGVKNALNLSAKKFAYKKYVLTFSNNQTLQLNMNKPIILSSLGFNKFFKKSFDDKAIVKAFDNMDSFAKEKMLNSSDSLIEILSMKQLDDLSSFLMLTYNEFENKLELVITLNNNNYGIISINGKTNVINGFKVITDIFEYVNGKSFVIPKSFRCYYKDNKIVEEVLTENQLNEAYEVAKQVADSCGSTFTKKFLKVKRSDGFSRNYKRK